MQEIYDTAIALLYALDAYAAFTWWVQFSAGSWIALLIGRFLYNVYFGVALGAARHKLRSDMLLSDFPSDVEIGLGKSYVYDDHIAGLKSSQKEVI